MTTKKIMKLIVGLGNPGRQYEKTRHNFGFMVVEQFLKDFEPVKQTVWEDSKKFKSDIAQIEWKPKKGNAEKVIIVKPKTYMNNSGLAVKLLTSYFLLPVSDIWVIHDDIDLPLGCLKIRFRGGSAGHHGINSMIEHLGTEKFWRFRIGIGVKSERLEVKGEKLKNVDDFVLGSFTGAEGGKVKNIVKRGSEALQTALEDGLPAAMNRFNTK